MASNKTFKQLKINDKIVANLAALGYERPSPIQAQSIPALLAGKDLLAQAQTGTGKTAAFALPILTQLNVTEKVPQALILTPTRELAIQVAEAFQSYAKNLKGFHVLAIYGGQDYAIQLKALKRGVQIVVGTPGRIMDHLRRQTLNLQQLKMVVLDEADEMLNMGFIDDIQWILEQIPHQHQSAFFSATIPGSIRKIANRYLDNPEKNHIAPKESTVAAIEQCYIMVSKNHKLEALTRFLEVEEINAAIIFTRTKNTTTEIAEKLVARGYAAAALNGDMNQAHREKVIQRIKAGTLDIVVATEVAARGLDVERISHVINYDIPQAAEAYVHRIGRTGRAGRKGKALLFVTPREKRMLNEIERTIGQKIHAIKPPSASQINAKRASNFAHQVEKAATRKDIGHYRELVENIIFTSDHAELDIAAALAYLALKGKPLLSETADIMQAMPEANRTRRRKPKRPVKSQGQRHKKPHNKKAGSKKRNHKKHRN